MAYFDLSKLNLSYTKCNESLRILNAMGQTW